MMTTDELVRQIVWTYELPPKLEERITRIATQRMHERRHNLYPNTPEALYNDIAHLVEAFGAPYGARLPLSLDLPVAFGSDTTFHEFIGEEDRRLSKFFEDERQSGMPLQEIVEILKGRIDSPYLDVVHRLLSSRNEKGGLILDVAPDKIDTRRVQDRLKELIDRFTINGKLVVPARPIQQVSFEPLNIEFGVRRFKGDPLTFFYEHRNVYEQLTRVQLYRVDRGLYETLRKHGQLDRAIPFRKTRGNRVIGPEDTARILAAFQLYRSSAYRTAKETGFSNATIVKYWIKAGLMQPRKKKEALPPEQVAKVLEAHSIYGGSANMAARNLPFGYSTIVKYWKRADLKISKPRYHSTGQQQSLTEEEIGQVVAAHKVYDGRASEAAEHLPYSSGTIIKYWRLGTLKPNLRKANHLTPDEIRIVFQAHTTYDGNAYEASQHLSYSSTTFRRRWKASGLELREPGGQSPPTNEIDEIVEAYAKYGGNAREAERHLPYSRPKIISHWRKAGFAITRAKKEHFLADDDVAKIVTAHETYHGNVSETAKRLGFSRPSVEKYWKAAGL